MNIKELAKTVKYLEINTKRKVNDIFAGNYKSSFRGQGLEVSDLRKYEEGDDARHIDWVVTAKQGKPYVKKFQETRELTTMLLIDMSSSMKFTTAIKSKSRIVLEATALLLFSALKNNDKFGVILFSDKVEVYIQPGKGRAHLLRILREIIQGFDRPGERSGKLKPALDFLNSTVKKRSICFLLSDNIVDLAEDKQSGLTALKIANRKHDFVYINVFDKWERIIELAYPPLCLFDQESGKTGMFDLSDRKLLSDYNKIRQDKIKKESEIVKRNSIDRLELSTVSNVYKELLLFFRQRNFRY